MFKKAELEIYELDLLDDIIVTSDPGANEEDPDVIWPF